MDLENVRVGSIAGNLLTLKHITRRVRLRKEILQIQMVRSICPHKVGGQSLFGHITRLFFMFRRMCKHTLSLARKEIILFEILFSLWLQFGLVIWRVIEPLNVSKDWINTGQQHFFGLSKWARSLAPSFLHEIFRTLQLLLVVIFKLIRRVQLIYKAPVVHRPFPALLTYPHEHFR